MVHRTHSRPVPRLRRAALAGRPRRRGGIIVELVLTLPIFLLLLLAIVQFGLYYVHMQPASLASRVGAEEAAQTANLDSYSEVPTEVVEIVEKQLATAGITECQVKLEHNVGQSVETLVSQPGGCACGPDAPLAVAVPGRYVRVTVCVPLTQLMPNCLKLMGYDISGQVTQFTTVRRYEVGTP